MKNVIRAIIRQALDQAKDKGTLLLSDYPEIVIEEPKDKNHGDFSTTVAMSMAKTERKSPKVIADAICQQLQSINGNVAEVQTAGPGFINLKMSAGFYLERFLDAARQGDNFGNLEIGRDQKVLLEFVSANPTGPLHVGHGRGAAVGATLAAILKKAGYAVDSEYYINDVGNQMNILGRSTLLRYRELLNESIEFPEDHYKGEYIKDLAQEIIDSHGKEFLDKDDETALPFFKKYSSDAILKGIEKDLSEFRVNYENWFSELSLYDDDSVDKALAWMRDKGFIYDQDGAVWLKSSAFKDDKDRVIIKQSGEKTYFCSDIAYHQNKINRGYHRIINIWGADHHGYVPRMQAVMEALDYDLNNFTTLLVQFVTLIRGGKKVQMSTRSGEFVTLEEVVSEVGVDATRFFFQMRSCDSHLEFDLDLAKKQSSDNPVFYIQYAHARICSVFRTAEEQGLKLPGADDVDLSLLKEEEAMDLVKKMLAFPEVIEKSALTLEGHRVAFYLQELVSLFHSYYKLHRVVTEDQGLSQARLFLLDKIRSIIRNGLSLLGVSSPESM